MLDERLRHRVAVIAQGDAGSLDEAAQERIFERLGLEGPAIVRAARRRRVMWLAAGPLMAAAAVVGVLIVRKGSPRTDVAVATGPQQPAVSAPVRTCESRMVPEGAARGFVGGADGARLDLGAVAVAAATPGSVVRLTEALACSTAFSLDSGTVLVHAKDLGGGELRVRAPMGEVAVHGTIFGVTQAPGSLTVEVVEGRVSVTDPTGTHFVSAGQRFVLSARGGESSGLAASRARDVRTALGVPEVVGLDTLQVAEPAVPATGGPTARRPVARVATGEAPPTAAPEAAALAPADLEPPPAAAPGQQDGQPAAKEDPLALAEEARRAGDFARARELYRRAGDGAGVTAEAALVALARMELSLGHAAAAREATKRRQERFGQGTLAPEALWIDVRTYRQTGDTARARELSAELVRRWPASPQARAAAQWLSTE